MKYAFVTTNLLDLRAEPRFAAERLNQLFYGQPVEVGGKRTGYRRVRSLRDNYAGWVDERFLTDISLKAARAYLKDCRAIVGRYAARVAGPTGCGSNAPHLLYYGTPLSVGRKRDGKVKASLPDGSKIVLQASAVVSTRKAGVTGRRVVAETRKLLGVPYLWGGISTAGCDCSGLVQTVFSTFGIALPRDTKDQIKSGKMIAREETRAGDLMFFKRHVAIVTGRDRIIHSSVGGGGVRINSLSSKAEDYRADLDADFVAARRVL